MEESRVDELLERVLSDGEIPLEEIPGIDLYMDQIITIFEERLAQNKRDPGDKLLTKTMIHNYSKEKLLQPLAGKKYSRNHILQILMIYQMKQVLSIQDIKRVLAEADVGELSAKKAAFSAETLELVDVYQRFLKEKKGIRESAGVFARNILGGSELEEMGDREARLLTVLNLTAMSNYMKRLAEELIDQGKPAKD